MLVFVHLWLQCKRIRSRNTINTANKARLNAHTAVRPLTSVFLPAPLPSRPSGATCAAASTAAACPHICPPLCISSVCGALRPPPTTASRPPVTATRWWFVVAGNQAQGWGPRERGLTSQCPLCWRETRKVWGLDARKEPKLLTSKPEIRTLWKQRPERRGGGEDRGRKNVREKSKRTKTGKETSVHLSIYDSRSQGRLLRRFPTDCHWQRL